MSRELLESLGYKTLPPPNLAQYVNNPQGFKSDLTVYKTLEVGTDLTVQNDITSGHDITAARNLTCGNEFITKDELVTNVLNVSNLNPRPEDTGIVMNGNLSVFPLVGQDPATNGIISGNGGGLTNLPPSSISGTPDYTFQSTVESFLPPYTVNYFVPEGTEVAVPAQCIIVCEFSGKIPGIYYWKTSSTIDLQYLWNSASGMIFWDGQKIAGETTWSAHQATVTEVLGILDPEYTLTRTYSPLIANPLEPPTAMVVQMESTNTSINPLQYDSYFVDFYRIASFSPYIAPPPAPTGFAVTGLTGYDAAVSWVCPRASVYSCTLTPPGDEPNPVSTTAPRLIDSNLTPGTSYSLVVQGANTGGSSPASAPFTFATNLLAKIVTGLTTSLITAGGFVVSFTASASPTPVTYTPTLTPSGGSAFTQTGPTEFTFTGLAPSTFYVLTIYPTNSAGDSPNSAPIFLKTLA